MSEFSIHPKTHIGTVALTVTHLERSLDFYQRLIGFRLHRREGNDAFLGAGGLDLLALRENPRASRYRGTSGFYHFAILFPDRRELARATDVPIKTIRFYEEVGLLPPAPRAANGYRLYELDDVRRLRFVRKVRNLDISLDDLRQVVSLWEHGQIRCSQVEGLLKQKLAEIEQRIKMLQTLQDDLQSLLHEAECCPSSDETQNSACHYVYNL